MLLRIKGQRQGVFIGQGTTKSCSWLTLSHGSQLSLLQTEDTLVVDLQGTARLDAEQQALGHEAIGEEMSFWWLSQWAKGNGPLAGQFWV